MSGSTERRYRTIVRWAWPAEWRIEHEDELLGTLAELSHASSDKINLREAGSLVVNGWRTRVRVGSRGNVGGAWADAFVRVAAYELAIVAGWSLDRSVSGFGRLDSVLALFALVLLVFVPSRWTLLLPAGLTAVEVWNTLRSTSRFHHVPPGFVLVVVALLTGEMVLMGGLVWAIGQGGVQRRSRWWFAVTAMSAIPILKVPLVLIPVIWVLVGFCVVRIDPRPAMAGMITLGGVSLFLLNVDRSPLRFIVTVAGLTAMITLINRQGRRAFQT